MAESKEQEQERTRKIKPLIQ